MNERLYIQWFIVGILVSFGFLLIACGDANQSNLETAAETTSSVEKQANTEQNDQEIAATELAEEGPAELTPSDGGTDSGPVDASEQPELPKEEEPQCGANKPCENGLVCDNGTCRGCTENNECTGDTLCLGGVCKTPECTDQKPCPDGRLCQSSACVDCQQDSECAKDKICVTGGCEDAQCSDASDCKDSNGKVSGQICKDRRCDDCADDASCGKDNICENKRCQTGCRNDNGCASPQRCNTKTMTCVDCLENKDCTQGRICQQNKCVSCQDDSECGSGKLCIQSKCITGDCRTRSDCQTTGQICQQNKCSACPRDGVCGNSQICVNNLCRPGCRRTGNCGSNQVCDTNALVCKGCLKLSDCQTGQICKNSQCTSCSKDSECGSGKLCVKKSCISGECRNNSNCSSGKVCIRYQCTTCRTDSQCGTGMLCINKVCKPGECRKTSDCKGKICKNYKCVACKNDTECGGQLCKSGVCTPCQSNKECGDGKPITKKLGPQLASLTKPYTFSFTNLPLGRGEITLNVLVEISKGLSSQAIVEVIADGVKFGFSFKGSISSATKVTKKFKLSSNYTADGKLDVKIRYPNHLAAKSAMYTVSIDYGAAKLCSSGICKAGNCAKDSECGTSGCVSTGGGCSDRTPQCLQSRCSYKEIKRSNAVCSSSFKRCLISLGRCGESKLGSSMATTTYNSDSDKPKYLSAAGLKYVKSWTDSGKDAHGFHATSSHSGLTVCHYAFRGLKKIRSVSDAYNQLKALNNLVRVTCKTPEGKTIGSCISGARDRYDALKNKGVLSDIYSRVKSGKCKGGLRIHGHSMGGAIASIVAAGLYRKEPNFYYRTYMKMTTYGAPRVFKDGNANEFHSKLSCYRWTTENDHIPANPGGDNRHFCAAYEIKKSGGSYNFNSKDQNYAPKWDFTEGIDHNSINYFNRLKQCR